ncbi:MAG: hypothetical protein EAZ97_09510 [Bacteroidetes bacterium]|nr:MAG: hypothetical protein EAZ97_09510 [Bacteroidota bacterium]
MARFRSYLFYLGIVFWLIVLASQFVFAQKIVLDNKQNIFSVFDHLEMTVDSDPEWNIKSVLSGDIKFHQIPNIEFIYNSPIHSHWFRFVVHNKSDLQKYLLRADFDLVELYFVDSTNQVQLIRNGRMLPLEEKSSFFGIQYVYLPIEIAQGQTKTFYLKVKDFSELSIQNEDVFHSIEHLLIYPEQPIKELFEKGEYFHGVFFGIMLIMMFYNLVIFVYLKDKTYIFYSLFLLFTGISSFQIEGFAFEYIWQDNPQVDIFATFYAVMLSLLFYVIFNKVFLQTETNLPVWNKILKALACSYVSIPLGHLFSFYNINLLIFIIILTILVILTLNIVSMVKGFHAANFLLIGNTLFLVGSIFEILSFEDLINNSAWVNHAAQIGTVLQILFFSVGLADRINELQQKILHQKEEKEQFVALQKEHLELEVAQRTALLLEQKTQIEQAYNNVKVLKKLGEKINETLDIDEIVESAYSNAYSLIKISIFGVATIDYINEQINFLGYFVDNQKVKDYPPIHLSETHRLLVWCVLHQKEVFTNDYENDYTQYIPQGIRSDNEHLPKSLIYIPLMIQEKMMGILIAQSYEKNAFDNFHIEALRNLSSYVAIGIDNAYAYLEITKAYDNIKVLKKVGEDINSTLDVEQIVKIAYESSRQLIDISGFGIGMLDKERNELEFIGYYNLGGSLQLDGNIVPLGTRKSLLKWCVDQQKEVYVNDYAKDYVKYFDEKPDFDITEAPKSVIIIPLLIQDKITGVMFVRNERKNAFNNLHLEILNNLASYVAIGIDNAFAYNEIKNANEIINSKNNQIMDSLRYAQTIQHAILPEAKKLSEIFSEYFVIYKPKDLVSGDFYWLAENPNQVIIALADCTGHGVPGAFMSIVGSNLLNSIVNLEKITEPADIIYRMHFGIIGTLKQENNRNNDGMDLSICKLDFQGEQTKLTFSGAKTSILYFQNGQIHELKGERQTVGGARKKEIQAFSNQEVMLQKNDLVYMTSDGFTDQHNAEKQKIGRNRLNAKLGEIAFLSLEEQNNILTELFVTHKGQELQRDDVTLIGLKV